MHIFQPLEHFTLSLEHGEHLPRDPLVPGDAGLPSLFRSLQDPGDPLAGALPLVERARGEDGLCGLAHGEDLDGGGGEEDGAAEEGLGGAVCGVVQEGEDAVDGVLRLGLLAVLHEAVGEQGERGVEGGGEGGGSPARGELGAAVKAGGRGEVSSRMAEKPDAGGSVARRRTAARGGRTGIGGEGEWILEWSVEWKHRREKNTYTTYVTQKVAPQNISCIVPSHHNHRRMGKRTADAADLPVSKAAATGQATAREPAADDEMGEFEDRWEDEIESEEEVVEHDADGEADGKSCSVCPPPY